MKMLHILTAALGLALLASVLPAALALSAEEPAAPGIEVARQKEPKKRWVTTDHSRHEILKAEFKSGPEVTKACLSCHNEASHQIHKTIHWTWLSPDSTKERKLGKAGDVVNNFCVSIAANEPRCTSCHIGYGWKDKNFDFASQENVDCLVCHEQTGTYQKFPSGAGHPAEKETKMGKEVFLPPDWSKVAQSVGRPTRDNCGKCHFYGGGGDAVKHGDLDSSMAKPLKSLDVHMAVDGANFDCTRCHTTVAHQISGRMWSLPAAERRVTLLQDDQTSRITCESCHTEKPHKPGVKANDHTDKVACQSCHVPAYARGGIPTKTMWDWSQAGQRDAEGKPVKKMGPLGFAIYDGMKGAFDWQKDVKPIYAWYNGSIKNLTVKDKIDPSKPVMITQIQGPTSDPNSRIYPFKLHVGKQPFDSENKTFVMPKLFGKPGSSAYWADYDWAKAIEAGMKYAGHPYSGKYDFVETQYVFPITHMVAPKDKTVACSECHAKDGRLASLTGFYMPGRDKSQVLDFAGWGLVVGSIVGVGFHGALRALRRKEKE